MDVIVVGAFHEIFELCKDAKLNVVGVFDLKPDSCCSSLYLGTDNDAVMLFEKYKDTPVIITPDKPSLREKLVNHYRTIGYKFATVISPTAKISPSATIGEGTIIQHAVNISACSRIGSFVKLNTMSNVMHDCVVGDYTTIAPNALLLGRCKTGERCYIGAHSTILPEHSIGSDSIVGAGAVVTKNVKPQIIVKGIPAK